LSCECHGVVFSKNIVIARIASKKLAIESVALV